MSCQPGMIRKACIMYVPCLVTVFMLLLSCPPRVEAAVFILYFRATGEEDHVLLEWETAQEIDNVGFNLYRGEVPELGQAQKLNPALIPSQCFGELFCMEPHYRFTDSDVVLGVTYYYWLESVDTHAVAESYEGNPVIATPGLLPTATPASTSTSTPTPAPTSTPTRPPTATPSSTPTGAPTSTPTSVPSATSTFTRTPSPTVNPATQASLPAAPALTTVGMTEPRGNPPSGEMTATPISTELMAAAPALPAELPGRISESGVRAGPALGEAWRTLSVAPILPCISIVSFLGVLLLAIALPVVRERGR